MNIIISDASGRTLREERINKAEDKLKLNLQSGIYFVILTDRNGLSQTKKLVIVR